jgi:hypothetical protein
LIPAVYHNDITFASAYVPHRRPNCWKRGIGATNPDLLGAYLRPRQTTLGSPDDRRKLASGGLHGHGMVLAQPLETIWPDSVILADSDHFRRYLHCTAAPLPGPGGSRDM